MALDGKWVKIPLAVSQVRDKEQHNLAAHEARTLYDIDVEQARGSWTMRRGHDLLFDLPTLITTVYDVVEYVRDGINRIAILCSREADPTKHVYERKADGTDSWAEIGGPTVTGDSSIEAKTDELRVFGSNIVWRGNVRALDLHRFNTSNGPLTVNPVVESNDLGIDDVSFSMTFVDTGSSIDYGYERYTRIRYSISAVYEGGQESNLSDEVSFFTYEETAPVSVQITLIVNASTVSQRIKQFRIYRRYQSSSGETGGVPSGALVVSDEEKRLVSTIDVYKMSESTWRSWTDIGGGQYSITASDYNKSFQRFYDVTGRPPYEKRDGYDLTSYPISIDPIRRHGRIFSDRAFFWGVIDDTGLETYNRLYYSHYSASGIHCPDIVLPANYAPMTFNIMGLVEAGTHRIVVGDIGYAVGYMRGSVKDQWQIHQGTTKVGCRSAASIAETPFGAVFLGQDGIYIIASLQYQGPFAKGIFREIENHPNLNNAIGGYSQQGMRYYLYIPGDPVAGRDFKSTEAKFYCMDLNTEDKRVRELSTPELNEIMCFGFGIDGTALFATDDGIFRAEVNAGETDFSGTPKPEVETGFIRLVGGDGLQQVRAVAMNYRLSGAKAIVSVKGYPSGVETIISGPIGASAGGTLTPLYLDAEAPKDEAHAIRIRTADDNNNLVHPNDFAVSDLRILVQGDVDGTI